jgi:hypothetical protein
MRYVKAACCLLCFLVLASNVWSMSRWSEARGVYDDLCYLRQAHLFQRFGFAGLDTNLSRDDDSYMASKLKEIGFPTWRDPANFPCHTLMPAANKRVLQYPPGTGFVLALFPEGFQVIPLYVAATVIVFGFALLAISYAARTLSILATAAVVAFAVYLMINPTKASYSMPPTMVACALASLLTARTFAVGEWRHRLLLTGLTGLVIGLAVNFRLPNLLLSAGYFLFFLISFLRSRNLDVFLQGAVFGTALLAGMVPTLLANAINAGNPFRTTYGVEDATPPDFGFDVAWQYATDLQFPLLLLAIGWTAWALRWRVGGGARIVALVVTGNLAVNLAFFLSHPVYTPYYMIPISMLSLGSLLFAELVPRGERAADNPAFRQPANA